MFRWGILGLSISVLLAALPTFAVGCKKGIGNPDDLGYAWRHSTLCEGVCSTDVSGRGLELASLHLGDAEGDLPDGELLLRWRNDRTSATEIHIRSTDPSLCYRVDARVPAGVDSYLWDTSLARKGGLSLDRLGFVVRNATDQRRLPVLLPDATDDSSLVILAVPEFPVVGLTARFVRAREDADSECAAAGSEAGPDPETSSDRRVAAGDVVRLEVARPPACGSWKLELAATPAPGISFGPKMRKVHVRLGSRP